MTTSNEDKIEIPLMPKARNKKYDVLNTILLWNALPDFFTWEEVEHITFDIIGRSKSWGYDRVKFWRKWNQVKRIEQGMYIKTYSEPKPYML